MPPELWGSFKKLPDSISPWKVGSGLRGAGGWKDRRLPNTFTFIKLGDILNQLNSPAVSQEGYGAEEEEWEWDEDEEEEEDEEGKDGEEEKRGEGGKG